MIFEAIPIKRVSQYGDNFICHADCPKCKNESFFAFGQNFCCIENARHRPFLFSNAEFRLVVGTFRKLRIGKRLVQTMYADQEGKCAYCFKELGFNYHVEHITPISIGGSNKRENLCLSCPRCNLVAGAAYFASYEAKRDYILNRRKQVG